MKQKSKRRGERTRTLRSERERCSQRRRHREEICCAKAVKAFLHFFECLTKRPGSIGNERIDTFELFISSGSFLPDRPAPAGGAARPDEIFPGEARRSPTSALRSRPENSPRKNLRSAAAIMAALNDL